VGASIVRSQTKRQCSCSRTVRGWWRYRRKDGRAGPDRIDPESHDDEDRRVKRNRSIPDPTVVPVLTYPDVREAVAWLLSAFGFVERLRIGENHRAQLRIGDGALIVADVRGDRHPPRRGEVAQSVLVRVGDARTHCERARSRGARILMEPTDFEYGERQYQAEDFAGHQWTFSETLADTAPETWGGMLIDPRAGDGS